MAMSPEEHRLWIDIERQLITENLEFEGTLLSNGPEDGTAGVASAARTIMAVALMLVAFFLVIVAVIVQIVIIGALGFVLMIIGGTWFRFPTSKVPHGGLDRIVAEAP